MREREKNLNSCWPTNLRAAAPRAAPKNRRSTADPLLFFPFSEGTHGVAALSPERDPFEDSEEEYGQMMPRLSHYKSEELFNETSDPDQCCSHDPLRLTSPTSPKIAGPESFFHLHLQSY